LTCAGIQLTPSSSLYAIRLFNPISTGLAGGMMLFNCETQVRPVFCSVKRIGSSDLVLVTTLETSFQIASPASGTEPAGMMSCGKVTCSVCSPAMNIALCERRL